MDRIASKVFLARVLRRLSLCIQLYVVDHCLSASSACFATIVRGHFVWHLDLLSFGSNDKGTLRRCLTGEPVNNVSSDAIHERVARCQAMRPFGCP